MIYYTIYMKQLRNSTGYIDIGLQDDQLLKDFEQYLDIGVRSHRRYKLADTAGTPTGGGYFSVDMAEVTAITAMYRDPPVGGQTRGRGQTTEFSEGKR